MLGKKLEQLLNEQINKELFSAYLYQSMSAYCASINLKGFANWTAVQAKEEMTHAMKFYTYVLNKGGKVTLTTINAPKTEWKDMVELFTDIYEHELKVTASINNLADVAMAEKDHATLNELQWFIKEQVQEESSALEILEQLKTIEGKGPGMFFLDRELMQRTFVDETANIV